MLGDIGIRFWVFKGWTEY